MKLWQKEMMQIEAISSRSRRVDIALGIGGLPRGRIVEARGRKARADYACAPRHCRGAEGRWHRRFLPTPNMRLTRSMPRSWASISTTSSFRSLDTGEQALEITDTLVRSNAIDAGGRPGYALVPRAEIEGEMGDAATSLLLQARLMSQALRS
jgi:recombination protein RecA